MKLGNAVITVEVPASIEDEVKAGISKLLSAKFASRLHDQDITLWREDDRPEASIRMNWMRAPADAGALLTRGSELRARLAHSGVRSIVLCGMGGSSLGPEMLAKEGGVDLRILDSTDPVAVTAAMTDLRDTAVIVSSKSGTTVETRSHLAAFEHAYSEAGISVQDRIVVITDPGSVLADYATEQGYELVLADPQVGGRFSVLTAYGLIPATVAGAHLDSVADDAQAALALLSSDSEHNPALALAAGAIALQSSLTIESADNAFGFGDWIEQLVAESTGKHGVGVLPVILPDGLTPPSDAPAIRWTGPLGASILMWEVATAAMGWLLDVNPFDQPDVERSKSAARALLLAPVEDESQAIATTDALLSSIEVKQRLQQTVTSDCYIAIQMFGVQDKRLTHELHRAISEQFGVPVTLGWGPRFLHSTGQLHKGGPARGVFLQVRVERTKESDVGIPGQEFTFARLLEAQAEGDAQVLEGTGQCVLKTRASISELVTEFASRP